MDMKAIGSLARTLMNVTELAPGGIGSLDSMAAGGPVVVGGAGKTPPRTNEELQRRVDRLELVVETLMMLLLEKKVIHEDEFRQWRKYVDELDGVADGRIREVRAPQACPSCGRKSAAEAQRCQYCGAELAPEILVTRQRRPAAE